MLDVLDSVIENLFCSFSNESLELANSDDNFFLLDFKGSKLFNNQYKIRTLQHKTKIL